VVILSLYIVRCNIYGASILILWWCMQIYGANYVCGTTSVKNGDEPRCPRTVSSSCFLQDIHHTSSVIHGRYSPLITNWSIETISLVSELSGY
jgi:hypothetical protein